MIPFVTDVIIAIGGYLAGKTTSLDDVRKELLTFSAKYNADSEKLKAAVIQIDEAIRNHTGDIDRIQKQLIGVESDLKKLADLATRRIYWNYGSSVLAAIALVVAIVSLAR